MASISSSRKGRRNLERDEDVAVLESNRLRIVGDLRETIHDLAGPGVDPETFEIRVDGVASREREVSASLDETLAVEDGATVPRSAFPVYRWELLRNVDGQEVEIASRYIIADGETAVLDLVKAPIATEAEIAEAVAWQPPAPPQPAPRVYGTIPRQANDAASYLGFAIGPTHGQVRVDLPAKWTVLGFHVPSAHVIGRVKASVDFPSFCGKMRLCVFDTSGNALLDVDMNSDEEKLDQIRLAAGDYLLALRPSSGITGTGSYYYRNARTLTNLPEKPLLDEVLWPNEDHFMEGNAPRCGVPFVLFSSR